MEVNMSDASQKWQCGSCGAEHGDEPAAISCCAQAPEITQDEADQLMAYRRKTGKNAAPWPRIKREGIPA